MLFLGGTGRVCSMGVMGKEEEGSGPGGRDCGRGLELEGG